MNELQLSTSSQSTIHTPSQDGAFSKSAKNHPHPTKEQKIILLPRNAYQEQSIWIGVLAKYFDIWAPTYPVSLKENGTRYTFDFHCESPSKLIKVFTLEDKNLITAYLDLPYAQYILFILDFEIIDCDQHCYCGECSPCQLGFELAEEVDAYICFRNGSDINDIMKQDEDGQWDSFPPYKY